MDGKMVVEFITGVILTFAFFLIARFMHVSFGELALGMIAFHIGGHIADRL